MSVACGKYRLDICIYILSRLLFGGREFSFSKVEAGRKQQFKALIF